MKQVCSRKCGAGLTVLLAMLSGCANTQNSVVAATGTVIGVELGTQQGTGTPTGVLGYRRAEFAHVPTNRGSGNNGGGVKDVANVVMELHYDGALSNNGSIYQRLAVGTEAVQAGSAAVLFAKKSDGTMDSGAAAAIGATAAVTISSADKVTNCLSKDGKLDVVAMKKVTDRAIAAGAKKVPTYTGLFGVPLPDSNLRSLLRQNGALAQELARHITDADCVGS